MMKIIFSFGILCSLLFSSGSCSKKREDSGLGTETSVALIEAAQSRSLNKLDPYLVNQGQMVHKIETQEIFTSQGPLKSITKESTLQITQVENFPEVRLLTSLKKIVDHREKDNFVYEVKNVFALAQQETESIAGELNLAKTLEVSPMTQSRKVTATEINGVSFHNLQEKTVVLVPPQKVQESEDCRQLSPCEIPADLITYDIVFHLSDGTTQKHQIEWHISSHVPFFAGILKQCATTLVPVDDLRVLVKQCTEVVDFNY